MRKQKMIVDTELTLVEYVVMVNDMALEYFNEDGEYQPHIGILNVMRLFYNHCVIESKFDNSHEIIDAMEMETMVEDDEFIAAFNDAIVGSVPGIRMDFANAYKDAMDIVEDKKHSVGRAVDSVKKALVSISDVINPILTDEHINMVSEIAKNIGNGNINAEAIIEAFGKSERFKEIIHFDKKDEIAIDKKVIHFSDSGNK